MASLTIAEILKEAKTRNAVYPSQSLTWLIRWIEDSLPSDKLYQAQYYQKHKQRKKNRASIRNNKTLLARQHGNEADAENKYAANDQRPRVRA